MGVGGCEVPITIRIFLLLRALHRRRALVAINASDGVHVAGMPLTADEHSSAQREGRTRLSTSSAHSDSDCADDSDSDGAVDDSGSDDSDSDGADDSNSDDSDSDGADDFDSDGADDAFAAEPNDGARSSVASPEASGTYKLECNCCWCLRYLYMHSSRASLFAGGFWVSGVRCRRIA
jgi:hypothetical protein